MTENHRTDVTRRNKRGQALSEYLILIALVSVASIGVIQVLSKNLKTRLADVSDALRGVRSQRNGEAVKREQIEASDMGDFSKGIRDNEGE